MKLTEQQKNAIKKGLLYSFISIIVILLVLNNMRDNKNTKLCADQLNTSNTFIEYMETKAAWNQNTENLVCCRYVSQNIIYNDDMYSEVRKFCKGYVV